MPRVFFPPALLPLTQSVENIDIEGASLGELLSALEARFPGIEKHLMDDGRLAGWVSVVVDGELAPRGLFVAIEPTSEVHFIPAIAGG